MTPFFPLGPLTAQVKCSPCDRDCVTYTDCFGRGALRERRSRLCMPTRAPIKLPNEAVFELRWSVQPGLAYADPGFPYLREDFTKTVERLGFPIQRDIAPLLTNPNLHGGVITKRGYVTQGRGAALGQNQILPCFRGWDMKQILNFTLPP